MESTTRNQVNPKAKYFSLFTNGYGRTCLVTAEKRRTLTAYLKSVQCLAPCFQPLTTKEAAAISTDEVDNLYD